MPDWPWLVLAAMFGAVVALAFPLALLVYYLRTFEKTPADNQFHINSVTLPPECREPFHGGSFFEHEGQPYCETHYHGKRGSLCAGCHKPIAGRCITAMFRKFHPEHFVCAFCLRQLNKGTFKEQNDKPYCHACFDKLFG